MNRRSFFKALCALPAAFTTVRMLPEAAPLAERVWDTPALWRVTFPQHEGFEFAWSSEPRGARSTHDVLDMIAKGTGIPRDVLTADVQMRPMWESVDVPAMRAQWQALDESGVRVCPY